MDYLDNYGLEGRSVLEIGSGSGIFHTTLVKKGASESLGIDISSHAIKKSIETASNLNLSDKSLNYQGDFIELEEDIGNYDIVVMDRMLCCYSSLDLILNAACRHSNDLIAITIPRKSILIKIVVNLLNTFKKFSREPFYLHLHSYKDIYSTMESKGFSRIHVDGAGLWSIYVFKKAMPNT
jgi:2-polyprenyl-3-methyl-5-hydroxy-6-metoxy-1,4-benzoquinol methylase